MSSDRQILSNSYMGGAPMPRPNPDRVMNCQQCGGQLSNARAALGLTLCSGACHRAKQIQSFQQNAISARARGDFAAERFALDALALIERGRL